MNDIERDFLMMQKMKWSPGFLRGWDPQAYQRSEPRGKVCTYIPCPDFTETELDMQWWSAFHPDGMVIPHIASCEGECGEPEGCYDGVL